MQILVDTRDVTSIPTELIVLWHFSDERPLRGTSGLIDWKLDGRISKFIMDDRITGEWQEKVMLGSFKPLVDKRLVLIGLGPQEDFNPGRIRDAGRLAMRTAVKLGIDSASITLPGVINDDIVGVAEEFLAGLVDEGGQSAFRPSIMCSAENIDEVLLGFQKTKVKLKDKSLIEITQVKQ